MIVLGRHFVLIVVLLFAVADPVWAQTEGQGFGKAYENATRLLKEGKDQAALTHLKRAAALGEKRPASEIPHRKLRSVYNALGRIQYSLGRYAEAIRAYERSVDHAEKGFGAGHPMVAFQFSNLAVLSNRLGDPDKAEVYYRKALKILEKTFGPEHPNVATVLNNLGIVLTDKGHLKEAMTLHRRALRIREAALKPDDPKIAGSMNSIADVLIEQHRYEDAQRFYARALDIINKAYGPDHPRTAQAENNLGNAYKHQKQHKKALAHYSRALRIFEAQLPADHPHLAVAMNNVAGMYFRLERYAEAEPLFLRALAIRETALGEDHPELAATLQNLANVYKEQEKYQLAERTFARGLAIFETALGKHPLVADAHQNSMFFNLRRGDYQKALHHSRAATEIYQARLTAASAGAATEQQAARRALGGRFINHVVMVDTARSRNLLNEGDALEESFHAAQLANASSTASAVARMSARFAKDDDALGRTVRKRQDLADERARLEGDLLAAMRSPSGENRKQTLAELREKMSGLDARLDALDRKLARDFPEYAELASPAPLSADDTGRLLHADEAMLKYVLTEKGSYLWVVRRDRAAFLPLPDVKRDALEKAVKRLRLALDPTSVRSLRDLPGFDAGTAHDLYRQIFAHAEPYLENTSHIFIVPAGPLQSLPFHLLLTRAPETVPKKFNDYKELDWLLRRYAFSTLPSVASLRAVRVFSKRAKGDKPFLGFGDPALSGDGAPVRGLVTAEVYEEDGATAQVDKVRQLAPLPDTADELRAMAKVFGASERDLYLRESASEPVVKRLDLSRGRHIAFATHGLISGEIDNVEPALVLTPPEKRTPDNDGLLTASEIAGLDLNADLVLLSACNTAAGGEAGAEGLSGLAKAFFYAGGRALLVSHWSVESTSAVMITTGMMRRKVEGGVRGHAEALRQAMLALVNHKTRRYYAHPMFWAPFVIVGEGGADKTDGAQAAADQVSSSPRLYGSSSRSMSSSPR